MSCSKEDMCPGNLNVTTSRHSPASSELAFRQCNEVYLHHLHLSGMSDSIEDCLPLSMNLKGVAMSGL